MNRNTAIIMIVFLVGLAAVTAILIPDAKDNKSTSETTQPSEDHSRMNSSQSSQSQSSDTAVSATEVEIEDYAYAPAAIKIKVGDTVTWTNKDSVQHDVKADNPSSDAPSSELLAKGESYSFTFEKAGTYTYHCSPHPYMKGTVIVE